MGERKNAAIEPIGKTEYNGWESARDQVAKPGTIDWHRLRVPSCDSMEGEGSR